MKNRTETTIKKVTEILNSQAMGYTEIIKIGEEKIRITIKSDSYDFQSYARVKVWNAKDKKWNFVDSISYSEMNTPAKLYYQRNKKERHDDSYYKKDRDLLLEMAIAILF